MAVVGVSSDDQEVADRFRESLDLPFPLVGDRKATIISLYDVKWPLIRLASRVTYLVGKDRRIRTAHKSARDIESHVQIACSFEADS